MGKIITAVSDKKQKLAEQRKKAKEVNEVTIDDQIRLAEILNDTPRLVALNGTVWEVRALRMGTQYLIAEKLLEITKAEEGSFGDVLKHFFKSIPAVVEVVALCVLNDRHKIYKNGREQDGFSDLYYSTIETLTWDCDPTKFMEILIDIFELFDISFFFESLNTLDMFRQMTTMKKRMRRDLQLEGSQTKTKTKTKARK